MAKKSRRRAAAGKSTARKPKSRKDQVMSRIKTLKDAVQAAIDNGATTVQEVHQRVAAMPFDQLEKIAAIEGLVRKARGLTDQSIGAVYDTIRAVNAKVGELADAALRRIGQGE